ncbi:GNAT family N-acetyltransferase [Falsiroseomonas stagni]|uniref:Ribosomal protein S18 acetylase RimI n=1 Tax=Falsiroseomonas stagni DSM 19981 TaxID=1123062 RepID=A0A1I4BZL3_9PROT|nr:GNAT family N-acetyltransferase [Falsiroseomonas stagni]SFK74238.1 Ribosomal protein S18 acetylase RimI [Falsiroseomonas stagni DSM 19981]
MIMRAAGPADAAAIAGLLAASWRDAYAALLPPALLAGKRDRLLPEWQALLAAPPGIIRVAEEAGVLHGMAALWLRGEDAYLDSLHVAPSGRGGGLGRRLLAEAMWEAVAAGARRASLRVIEGNDGAIRFYTRLGGRVGAPEAGEVAGHPVRLLRLHFDDLSALVLAAR